jgi:hypothetical protein
MPLVRHWSGAGTSKADAEAAYIAEVKAQVEEFY